MGARTPSEECAACKPKGRLVIKEGRMRVGGTLLLHCAVTGDAMDGYLIFDTPATRTRTIKKIKYVINEKVNDSMA